MARNPDFVGKRAIKKTPLVAGFVLLKIRPLPPHHVARGSNNGGNGTALPVRKH